MSTHQRRPGLLRKLALIACLMLTPAILLAAALLLFHPAAASSHREAPMISKDPYADNTDSYFFMPRGSMTNVVLAGSWIPFESPDGGPNFYEWDDNVRYDIHVDVDGNATSDVTYTLSSRTEVQNPNSFLYNRGPIAHLNDPNWNRRQYITVTEEWAPGMQPAGANRVTQLVANQLTSPSNIGPKSIPNYGQLESEAIRTFQDPATKDTIKVFGGQTDDPFWVDLQVFDLLTLRGQNPPVGYPPPARNNVPIDSLAGYNVHSFVVELPLRRLVHNKQPVLGVWASSRRASMPVLGAAAPPANFRQISRLGMPLVNEAVIPYALKDAFNSLRPDQDLATYTGVPLLQKAVEDPELGTLLCQLYKVPLPGDTNNSCHTNVTVGTPRSGRGDIFDIFLTGMKLAKPFTITTANGATSLPAGFVVNQPPKVQPAEMIRLNTNISGTLCSPTPSRLGVLGGDACGFPNGRRLDDDVVEIELLSVAGAAYPVLDGRDAKFHFNPDLIKVLSDNVDHNDVYFRNTFPYLAMAQSGQTRIHQNFIEGVLYSLLQPSSGPGRDQSPLKLASLAGAGVGLALGLYYLLRRLRV